MWRARGAECHGGEDACSVDAADGHASLVKLLGEDVVRTPWVSGGAGNEAAEFEELLNVEPARD
jgi:hypothetical protein